MLQCLYIKQLSTAMGSIPHSDGKHSGELKHMQYVLQCLHVTQLSIEHLEHSVSVERLSSFCSSALRDMQTWTQHLR